MADTHAFVEYTSELGKVLNNVRNYVPTTDITTDKKNNTGRIIVPEDEITPSTIEYKGPFKIGFDGENHFVTCTGGYIQVNGIVSLILTNEGIPPAIGYLCLVPTINEDNTITVVFDILETPLNGCHVIGEITSLTEDEQSEEEERVYISAEYLQYYQNTPSLIVTRPCQPEPAPTPNPTPDPTEDTEENT